MALSAISNLQPYTQALRHALKIANDSASVADLIFLEAWEMHRPLSLGVTLRARQIRRANAELAAEIAAELAARRLRSSTARLLPTPDK
jgi:hypothetical protein